MRSGSLVGGSSFGWGVYIVQKTASHQHHGGDGGWRSESSSKVKGSDFWSGGERLESGQ